jgi:hypothetical protein
MWHEYGWWCFKKQIVLVSESLALIAPRVVVVSKKDCIFFKNVHIIIVVISLCLLGLLGMLH